MAYLDNYDSRQLRTVLGCFTTGVTVVTTVDANGTPHGITANSFSSVSLDPPLVLWSQAVNSKSLHAYQQSPHFAVNILADDQVDISNHFAKSQENKFATIVYDSGLGGVPILRGTVAHFECTKVAEYPAGDHIIYLGKVERVAHSGIRPLAFAHGRYMVPYAHDLGPRSLQFGSTTFAGVDAIQVANDALASFLPNVQGHSLCLSVWGNHGPTTLRWARGSNSSGAHLRTGLVMSMTKSAVGRAFAAFLPAELTRPFIAEDLRLSRVADEVESEQKDLFEVELDEARKRGIARITDIAPSDKIEVSVNAFSAPVYDPEGNMIMALSVAADSATLTAAWDGAVPAALQRAAGSITAQIERNAKS